MKIKHITAMIVILGSSAFATSAFAENEWVKNYADTSGSVVKNNYGDLRCAS